MAWCGHGSVRQGADNREEFLQLCIHAELLSGVSAQSEKHPSNEQVAQAQEILPVRQRPTARSRAAWALHSKDDPGNSSQRWRSSKIAG